MALSLAEIKELISFGHELGLQQIIAEGVSVVYGPPGYKLQIPDSEPKQAEDKNTSGLPEELRHYSALGKSAWGKTA